jgi:hypothetical protein
MNAAFEEKPIQLYRVKGFKSLVFDEEGLRRLTPLNDIVQKGAREAWALARKIDASAYLYDDGHNPGLTSDEIDEIFGDDAYPYNFPVEKALIMYRAWERKNNG